MIKKEKSFGIEMMTYGVNNVPLGVKEKWFSTAEQLAAFYEQNTMKTNKRRKRSKKNKKDN